MTTATIHELKQELAHYSQMELIELSLRLAKFKKENKELLTYLLYESKNESNYILSIQKEIDFQFDEINTSSYYYIKKSVRKILRMVKKYIRYSKRKETEIELLIYFCFKLKELKPTITNNLTLRNIYKRQLFLIEKIILTVHEDLQYDYLQDLKTLHLT